MNHILLCDDDPDLVRALEIYLSDPTYTLFRAYTGREALEVVKQEEIHLILLDIMMPEMDGLTAMAKIREISNVPIILLTAKSEEMDKILGLDCGADDYITKPFHPVEVAARVRSQLRRYRQLGGGTLQSERFVIGGIELDDRGKEVTLDGEPVSLTPKEYEILKLLIMNPDRVYAPREIYRLVWKEKSLGCDNTVAVHIRHLREKLEINPAEPRYIKVVFGQGYKMEKGRNG